MPDKKINFTISTNGVLIDEEVAKFLARNKFVIGISLDGLTKANNKVRVYKSGKGTFDDILKGIEVLAKYIDMSNKSQIGVSTCLSRDNFELVNNDFLDFLRNLGIKRVNLEADIIDLVGDNYGRIARKLFKLFKHGKSIGLTVYGYWSKPFFTVLKNRKPPIAFCTPTRGEAIAIAPEGRVQSCVYINELTFPLDKLDKINTIPKYRKFLVSNWKSNIEECKGCELEGICLGGCYVTRNIPNKEVFKYRCVLKKQLTPLLIRDFLKENYERVQEKLVEN